MTYTDSANNHYFVEHTPLTYRGERLFICRLVDDPSTGYVTLALDVRGGAPLSSGAPTYCPDDNRAVCGWFGADQRWPRAIDLIAALLDE